MKTIRVTFRKAEARAVCLLTYRETDFRHTLAWSGDKEPFLVDGTLPLLGGALHSLEQDAAHQAALCGATVTIEDLGGEAMEWTDEVLPPGEKPPPMP